MDGILSDEPISPAVIQYPQQTATCWNRPGGAGNWSARCQSTRTAICGGYSWQALDAVQVGEAQEAFVGADAQAAGFGWQVDDEGFADEQAGVDGSV